MAGISIPILSDVKDFVVGAKKVGTSVEDIADSLDDLARDAKKAGSKTGDALSDGVKDGVKDADRQLEKLEDGFAELARATKADSKKTGDALGDSVKKGTREAGEGLSEFKDEANSTAKESAASFDGSANSIADLFQELAANSFSGFGPAGAAAGIAVAAGLGYAISALQVTADSINDAGERTGELADEIVEAGGDLSKVDLAGKFREWGLAIKDTREFYEVWQKSAVSNVSAVKSSADDLGVSFDLLFRGLSGYDEEAREGAIAQLKKNLEALEDQQRKNRDVNPFAGFSDNAALDSQSTAIKNQITELEGVNDVIGDAEDANRALSGAIDENTDSLIERNGALRETYDAVADAERAELNYQESLATTKAAIEENGKTHDRATEKGRANEQALLDQRDATLDLAEASKVNGAATDESNAKITAGRDAFIESAKAAGYSQQEAEKYATKLGLIPEKVITNAELKNAQKVEDDLKYLARQRDAQVALGLDPGEYNRQIANLLAQKLTKTVEVVMQSVGSGRKDVG